MKKVAIYYIATSIYKKYFARFYMSIDKFLSGYEKTIILMTDDTDSSKYSNLKNVKWYHIDHYPWPVITLYKMYHILNHFEDTCDYHFYFNSNVIFNENGDYFNIEKTISNNKLIAFRHWVDNDYTFLENPQELPYIQGGYFGGNSSIMKKMCKKHVEIVNEYLNKKYTIPQWHDETIFNEWCKNNKNIISIENVHKILNLYDAIKIKKS